jgi:hypothetical protein
MMLMAEGMGLRHGADGRLRASGMTTKKRHSWRHAVVLSGGIDCIQHQWLSAATTVAVDERMDKGVLPNLILKLAMLRSTHPESSAGRLIAFSVGLYLFLCAVLVAGVLIKTHGHLVYSLDDPYIHLGLAENIAKGHYGINLTEYSSPSSSILWPFLLVPFAGNAAACLCSAGLEHPVRDSGCLGHRQDSSKVASLCLVATIRPGYVPGADRES